MSAQDQPTGSSNNSTNGIILRGAIVAILLGLGGWYVYSLANRRPLQEVLAEGEMALARRDLPEAERIAKVALGRASKAPGTKVYVAQVHIAKREFDKALELLKQVPAGTKDTPSARAIQGMVEMTQLGQLDKAEALFQEALEQDPNFVYALTNYSNLLRIATRTQDRTQVDLRLIELHAPSPGILFQLVLNWGLHTSLQQVEYLYQKSPEDSNVLLGMGEAALTERRYEEAEKYLRAVLEKNPKQTEAYHKLGRVFLQQRDQAGLLAWLKSLPKEAVSHPGIWQVKGKWSENGGDLEGAARCYWEALKLDVNYQEACYLLGQTLMRLQRGEEAKPFLERARLLESYLSKVHALNAVASAKPEFAKVRPLLSEALTLGLAWEALGWAELLHQLQEDKEIDKVGEKLYELVQGKPLQRTYSEKSIALKLDLNGYSEPKWEELKLSTGEASEGGVKASAEISFEDQAKSLGIDFQYFNSSDKKLRGLGRSYEFTGGGVAVLDYDQDGLPDVYLTQGCEFPTDEKKTEYTDRLYRNLGQGKFVDVTKEAGLVENRYSQGVSAGDLNNDGYPDLYVANLGHNRLYLNNGDGTFEDVTSRYSAAGSNVWTTSCAIVDINGDQLPDIYSVNYLGDEAVKTICRTADSDTRLHACIPKQFPAEDDQLFLSLGDGRFRNVSRDAGILLPDGKGLGIVAGDLTGKGGNSLFIANDSTPNYLLVNSITSGGSPRFTDQALISGLAVNQAGAAQACMGVAVDDFDRNGLIDLFVTNFTEEGSTLYLQQSEGMYSDQTRDAGLYDPTVMILGFGTQSLDADLDGWPDLIQTNGHIDTYKDVPFGYEMSPQFFHNLGGGKFQELPSSVLGPFFSGKYLGRGMARIDWNQDGLEDVIISHLDVPVAVLTNTTKTKGNFLAVELRGTKSSRDALGAVVKVKVGDQTLVRHLTGGDGYEASNERVLYFGLGDRTEVDGIEIRWPNGETQSLPKQAAGRSLRVIEGRAEPVLMWEKG